MYDSKKAHKGIKESNCCNAPINTQKYDLGWNIICTKCNKECAPVFTQCGYGGEINNMNCVEARRLNKPTMPCVKNKGLFGFCVWAKYGHWCKTSFLRGMRHWITGGNIKIARA